MSQAFCCEICEDSDPRWRITRRGDAVVSWACNDDLDSVLDGMQRDWELTELVVVNAHKAREWAEITGKLEEIGATK
jgi:hypothetical protein